MQCSIKKCLIYIQFLKPVIYKKDKALQLRAASIIGDTGIRIALFSRDVGINFHGTMQQTGRVKPDLREYMLSLN